MGMWSRVFSEQFRVCIRSCWWEGSTTLVCVKFYPVTILLFSMRLPLGIISGWFLLRRMLPNRGWSDRWWGNSKSSTSLLTLRKRELCILRYPRALWSVKRLNFESGKTCSPVARAFIVNRFFDLNYRGVLVIRVLITRLLGRPGKFVQIMPARKKIKQENIL